MSRYWLAMCDDRVADLKDTVHSGDRCITYRTSQELKGGVMSNRNQLVISSIAWQPYEYPSTSARREKKYRERSRSLAIRK
jgi:hypothetical protein